jgi:putative PIN family toxin of toxin-antitoxin system
LLFYGTKYDTIASSPKIVIDTNVLLSALRSNRGASHKLLKMIPENKFTLCSSPALVLEYEDVLKRHAQKEIQQSEKEVDDILNYLCSVGEHTKIYYLWRPTLKDPSDDMVLELAVASGAKVIVTYNLKDFSGSHRFKVTAKTPKDFLHSIGAIP